MAGETITLLTDPLHVARFWSKVAVGRPGVCWEWQAALNENGYGVFRAPGEHRNIKAHRVAWSLAHRRNLDHQEVVSHACDNPPCVNPAHLVAASQPDNIADMVQKGRQRGSRHSRLTGQDIVDICLAVQGGEAQISVASRFQISQSYVSMLVSGKRWRAEGVKSA